MRCPDCRMGYVPEVPEDFQEHKKYHDKIVNGVPSRRLKNDWVVWEEGYYRITVVIHATSSISQRERAQEAGGQFRGHHTYLLIIGVSQRLRSISASLVLARDCCFLF
jgi:hypothetical protein